jgi:hypothetical protein
MNKLLAISGLIAIAMLAACTGPYHGEYAANYAANDGYYDGYYGPYPGGYWSSDGYFYYSDGRRGYRRDDDGHFRHESFENGSPFHAERDYRD